MSQPKLADVRDLVDRIGKHTLTRNLRLDVEVSKPATATEPVKLRRRYVFAYTLDGKAREKTIGDYAIWTLSAAYVEADRLRTLVKSGIDPIREELRIRNQNIADARKPKPMSFGQVADHWANTMRPNTWGNSSWDIWLNYRKNHFEPIWNLPIAEIERPTVLAWLEPYWPNMIQTGERCHNHAERIFDHAINWGWFPETKRNPAAWGKTSPFGKRPDHEHYPAVAYERLPDVFQRLMEVPKGVMGTAEPIARLTILTASRPTEVTDLTWQELNLDSAVWILPASRDKEGQERRTPLTPEAMSILQNPNSRRPLGRFQPRTPTRPVFPGRIDSKDGFVRKEIATNAIRRCVSHPDDLNATLHGTARSGFKTWTMDETDFDQNIVELCLGHRLEKLGGAAYYRSDALRKRGHGI